MDQENLVTIAILNYNGLEYLKETLPAILGQNYNGYEVVVVDNGSNDGSVEYLQGHQDIKLIKNSENLGYSKGKNIAVENARGEYVLLLDEDILIEDKDFISKLIRVAREKKDFASLSMLLVNKDETKTEYYGGFYGAVGIKNRKFVDYEKIINFADDLVEVGAPDGGALLVRKEDFLETGGYDESQIYFCDVGDWGPRATILTGKKHYLYTKKKLVHLGVKRRTDNSAWCKKYRYVFLGGSKLMLKNYSFGNLLISYPYYFLFMIAKTVKQTLSRRSCCVVYSFLVSIFLTLWQLPQILRNRKEIQSKRILKEDVFLKIKVPDFE